MIAFNYQQSDFNTRGSWVASKDAGIVKEIRKNMDSFRIVIDESRLADLRIRSKP